MKLAEKILSAIDESKAYEKSIKITFYKESMQWRGYKKDVSIKLKLDESRLRDEVKSQTRRR